MSIVNFTKNNLHYGGHICPLVKPDARLFSRHNSVGLAYGVVVSSRDKFGDFGDFYPEVWQTSEASDHVMLQTCFITRNFVTIFVHI